MDYEEKKSLIEALLFVSGDEGLSLKQLAEIVEMEEEMLLDLLYEMMAEWKRMGRGIQIVEVAKHFQLTTLPKHAPYIGKLANQPQNTTLSQSAIEVLSIIAYRQPITRLEIEEIRGVKSDRAIQTLMARGLIKEMGRAEGVGRAILYGTTPFFLEHFGLNSLDELPSLPEDLNHKGNSPLFSPLQEKEKNKTEEEKDR
ncbi:chromosome condensation and segregation factor [[Clostridium] ultunense Esp]|uniref:SMC-Scp complex subunit ScpB n=1 Tax=Thermicanus aegyptius TaxID=94009 RepID=UPI0002B703A2|nr:SMC-Scp complex subunit ScpB [Thermicanus aegyptius]CCQ95599.1 chromosome condensation and segregation factor [[Clostridium] ultunense Esp]